MKATIRRCTAISPHRLNTRRRLHVVGVNVIVRHAIVAHVDDAIPALALAVVVRALPRTTTSNGKAIPVCTHL